MSASPEPLAGAVETLGSDLPPAGLSPRYEPGQDPEPLLRALAAGLLGTALLLVVDRILPSTQLALFDPLIGAARPLPQGLLWPALCADLLVGDPSATGIGVSALGVALSLASFVWVYGQLRRFVPLPDPWRGLIWAAILGLMVGPTLLAHAIPWLAAGSAGGASPIRAVAAALWLLVEPALGLAAYGLSAGLLCPVAGRSEARTTPGRQEAT